MLTRIVQNSINLVPFRVRPFIKLVPGIAWIQRLLVAKMLVGREFVHKIDAGPAKGLYFPTILPDDKNVWTGTYELPFAQAVLSQVRKGSVCYDIGAWRGYFSGLMALAGAGKVYSFEPFPSNAQRIEKLIKLNPLLNVILIKSAVGDAPGKSEFQVMNETSMGKLSSSSFQSNARSKSKLIVSVVSIDDEVDSGRISPPDSIKLDVEGAELEVLKGASRTISKYRPKFVMELHGQDVGRECEEFLRACHYRISYIGKKTAVGDVYHIVAEPTAAHF